MNKEKPYLVNMETTRLLFRRLTMEDLPDVHYLHSIPETDEFNTLGIPATVQETAGWVSQWLADTDTEVWHITLKGTQQFIGLAGMIFKPERFRAAEIWYKIDVAHWGKGLATETARQLLHYGFTAKGLHRIEAGCAVENIGSVKVLEKVGMLREGRKRAVLPVRGGWLDNFMYAVLATDPAK